MVGGGGLSRVVGRGGLHLSRMVGRGRLYKIVGRGGHHASIGGLERDSDVRSTIIVEGKRNCKRGRAVAGVGAGLRAQRV